jgi:U6 snRNA-associated Sm-like protein LSm7
MSERGNSRGGRGGRGGGRGGGDHEGGHRGGRGGRGGAHGGSRDTPTERPKKENILDLGKYMDKEIVVKFNGGREGEQILSIISPIARADETHRFSCGNFKGL